ncbi:MAG: hypothetical protein ACTSVI_06880 [Promethearchaeota archaeon]
MNDGLSSELASRVSKKVILFSRAIGKFLRPLKKHLVIIGLVNLILQVLSICLFKISFNWVFFLTFNLNLVVIITYSLGKNSDPWFKRFLMIFLMALSTKLYYIFRYETRIYLNVDRLKYKHGFEFIIQNGYYNENNFFSSWTGPGIYFFMVAFHYLTNIPSFELMTFFTPLMETLYPIIFYNVLRKITGRDQIAFISSWFYALSANFIFVNLKGEILIILFVFICLYLIKRLSEVESTWQKGLILFIIGILSFFSNLTHYFFYYVIFIPMSVILVSYYWTRKKISSRWLVLVQGVLIVGPLSTPLMYPFYFSFQYWNISYIFHVFLRFIPFPSNFSDLITFPYYFWIVFSLIVNEILFTFLTWAARVVSRRIRMMKRVRAFREKKLRLLFVLAILLSLVALPFIEGKLQELQVISNYSSIYAFLLFYSPFITIVVLCAYYFVKTLEITPVSLLVIIGLAMSASLTVGGILNINPSSQLFSVINLGLRTVYFFEIIFIFYSFNNLRHFFSRPASFRKGIPLFIMFTMISGNIGIIKATSDLQFIDDKVYLTIEENDALNWLLSSKSGFNKENFSLYIIQPFFMALKAKLDPNTYYEIRKHDIITFEDEHDKNEILDQIQSNLLLYNKKGCFLVLFTEQSYYHEKLDFDYELFDNAFNLSFKNQEIVIYNYSISEFL